MGSIELTEIEGNREKCTETVGAMSETVARAARSGLVNSTAGINALIFWRALV